MCKNWDLVEVEADEQRKDDEQVPCLKISPREWPTSTSFLEDCMHSSMLGRSVLNRSSAISATPASALHAAQILARL